MENIKLFNTLGFIPSEDKIHRNNFLPATLHCLTNMKFLNDLILYFDGSTEKNKLLNTYKNLLQKIQKAKKEKAISIEDFEKILFESDDYKEDKEKRNPKYLFHNLLQNFHNFYSTQYKNTTIFDKITVEFQTTLSCPECHKEIEEKKNGEKYLIYDICKEYCNKNGNKDYNIYDCLRSYLKNEKEIINKKCTNCKKETKQKAKKIYKTLPDVLIIQVDYGKDKNFKLDKGIKFKENLDFSEINNIDVEEKYKNKKYYLSSLICVREILDPKKEYFYTFCGVKNDNNDKNKYWCYNEEKVHEVININNKIEKEKINLDNKKQRFPYILIYTVLEQKI